MNRLMCIMKDMESGITLMKDKNDAKNWTKKDLFKMKRKNLIQGYDVAYDNQFVIFDTSEVQYMYLIDEENISKIVTQPITEVEEDDESNKWNGSAPQPAWGGNPDNGVMFQ